MVYEHCSQRAHPPPETARNASRTCRTVVLQGTNGWIDTFASSSLMQTCEASSAVKASPSPPLGFLIWSPEALSVTGQRVLVANFASDKGLEDEVTRGVYTLTVVSTEKGMSPVNKSSEVKRKHSA